MTHSPIDFPKLACSIPVSIPVFPKGGWIPGLPFCCRAWSCLLRKFLRDMFLCALLRSGLSLPSVLSPVRSVILSVPIVFPGSIKAFDCRSSHSCRGSQVLENMSPKLAKKRFSCRENANDVGRSVLKVILFASAGNRADTETGRSMIDT